MTVKDFLHTEIKFLKNNFLLTSLIFPASKYHFALPSRSSFSSLLRDHYYLIPLLYSTAPRHSFPFEGTGVLLSASLASDLGVVTLEGTLNLPKSPALEKPRCANEIDR